MRRSLLVLAVLSSIPLLAGTPAFAAERSLGVGVHYWQTLDNLGALNLGIDESGTSFLLAYQSDPEGLFKWEADLEYFSDSFAGATDSAISPQVFLLLGDFLYGGVGVGITYSDSFANDFSDPFYGLRLGLDFAVLPHVHLDVNANYQTGTFSELDNFSSDTLTLGALVRFRAGRR